MYVRSPASVTGTSARVAQRKHRLRQIAVTGPGRERPALFLANHPHASPHDMIMNYARGNGIEDGLGTNVNCFHINNL
ncbi:MAG: hypothetical protein WKF77_08175 [Planctomycetaceae bacterium]